MDLSYHCDGLIALCNEAIENYAESYYEKIDKPKYITNEMIDDCEDGFIEELKRYPLSYVVYKWLKQIRNIEYDVEYDSDDDGEKEELMEKGEMVNVFKSRKQQLVETKASLNNDEETVSTHPFVNEPQLLDSSINVSDYFLEEPIYINNFVLNELFERFKNVNTKTIYRVNVCNELDCFEINAIIKILKEVKITNIIDYVKIEYVNEIPHKRDKFIFINVHFTDTEDICNISLRKDRLDKAGERYTPWNWWDLTVIKQIYNPITY